MPDYQGGNVVLDVIPSFDRIQRVIGAEAQRWGRESGREYKKAFDQEVGKGAPANPGGPPTRSRAQGKESGGAFADGFRRQVDAALKALPPVRVGVATTEAEQKIRDLAGDLRALSDQTVGVDIDAGAATAELRRIHDQIEDLSRSSSDIQVRADTATALAALRAVAREVEDLDGQDADVDVRVNDFGSINTFAGRLALLGAAGAALGPLIVPAAGLAAVAVAGIGAAAVTAVAGVSVLAFAFKGVGDAVKAMGDNQRASGANAAAAAAQATASAAAVASAQRGVESAERGVANARRNAARQAEDAARRVTDAQREVGEAAMDAARAVERAVRSQVDAERDLADAQQVTRRAQEDLTAARADARAELEDLERSVRGAALAEEDANLALIRAQERLATARAEGVTGVDLQEIDLAVRQAQLRLDEARDRNVEVNEQAAKATAAGVEGADQVLAAQERVAAARRGEEDAARRLQDAETAVTDARVEGAERVAAAQQGVADAVRAQQQQQEASAMAIVGALASLEGAQASLAQATQQSGVTSAASVDKLREALDALSPAGVVFAGFIYSLRDELGMLQGAAQGAFLPGLQTAIETLLPSMPALVDFITRVGTAMGGIAEAAAVDLMGPAWAPFFDMVSRTAVPQIEALSSIFGGIALGVANLMVAFEPLTTMFLDWLNGGAQRFAEWAAGLTSSSGFQGFIDYVVANGPALGAMFGSLVDMFGAFIEAAAPFAPTVAAVVGGIADFITSLPPGVLAAIVGGIAALVLGFQILAPIIGVVVGFAGALAGGMTVAGAAVAALGGPVTLIVAGLLLLGVALVAAWHHSETFRNVVTAVWGAVKDAAAAVVDWFTGTAVPFLQGVWDAIAAGATWLWENGIKPVLDAILRGWDGLVTGVKWLWDRVLKPTWDTIAAVAGWLWNTVLAVIFLAIRIGWKLLTEAFQFYWNTILKPVWDAISTAARWLWDNVLRPVWDLMKAGWDSLLRGMKVVWDNVLKPVFDAVGTAVDAMKRAFDAARDGITSAWNAIRDNAKAPIRFVVDTIINGAIIDNFNKVARTFGSKEIERVQLPQGFATGGILPGYTPGRDVHRFISPTGGMLDLSGGEAILRPELTRALGAGWVHRANQAARMGGTAGAARFLGGYADGGILGWLGRKAGDATDAISGVVRSAGGLFTDPAGTLRRIVESLVGTGNTGFAGLIAQVPLMLVDRLADALAMVRTGDDTAVGPAGPVGGGWKAMSAMLLGAFPNARITSTFRPGAITAVGTPSMHGLGRAIDIGSPNMGMFNWLAQNYPGSKELFYSPAGPGRQILNGRPGARLAPVTVADHYDHIHWAMANGGILPSLYDDGGMLPPGLSMVMNATGKPEPVLTTNQLSLLQRAADNKGGDGRPGLVVNAYGAREDVLAARVVQRFDEREALNL